MKKILLILLLLPCLGYGQKYMGQTKKYIINEFSLCYIVENDSTYLQVTCDKYRDWAFNFKDQLCKDYSFICTAQEKSEIIYEYIKNGYTSTTFWYNKDNYGDRVYNNKYWIDFTKYENEFIVTIRYNTGGPVRGLLDIYEKIKKDKLSSK